MEILISNQIERASRDTAFIGDLIQSRLPLIMQGKWLCLGPLAATRRNEEHSERELHCIAPTNFSNR